MSDLGDLYQELILDHQRRPRNFKVLEPHDRSVRGHNPLCGDELVLFLKLDGGVVTDVGFQGTGCAISKASASMMTERIKGRTIEEVNDVFRRFHHMLTVGDASEEDQEALGKLVVFGGVREFPARVKCATLSWQTLMSALAGDQTIVSTEQT